MGNLALELSRLEMDSFIKRRDKEIISFTVVDQSREPSPGALKAGSEHIHKAT